MSNRAFTWIQLLFALPTLLLALVVLAGLRQHSDLGFDALLAVYAPHTALLAVGVGLSLAVFYRRHGR